jgi:hypothetical protein
MNLVASFIMSLMLYLPVPTQLPSTQPSHTQTPNGAFFALSVADISIMSRWYQDNLELKIISSGEAPNQIAKFAILEGNNILIEIIQHSKAQPRKAEAVQIHGIFKIGLLVPNLNDVYSSLKKRNITITYELMRAKDVPLRSFAVRDPEGNLVQFFGK